MYSGIQVYPSRLFVLVAESMSVFHCGINTISNVRKQTDSSAQHHLLDYAFHLNHFEAVIGKDLKMLLLSSPLQACALDPIPVPFFLHEIINGLPPFLVQLLEISSLLKSAELDPENISNDQPISNLTFPAKVLERTIAQQTVDYGEV